MPFKESYKKLLLVTVMLSSSAITMEKDNDIRDHDHYIFSGSDTFKSLAPKRTVGQEICSEAPKYIYQNAHKELRDLYRTCHKVYHDGWESIITDTLETFMKRVNKHYLTRHLSSPSQKLEEFDVETLRPLVEELRKVMGRMVRQFCMQQPLFDKNGETLYKEKTVFHYLAKTLIPDGVPFKGWFINLITLGPISNYLEYKMDEMIIKVLVDLHYKTTGKTMKKSIEDLVKSIRPQKTSSALSLKGHQPVANENHISVPNLPQPKAPDNEDEAEDFLYIDSKDKGKEKEVREAETTRKSFSQFEISEEISPESKRPEEPSPQAQISPKAYSYVWQYFQPQFNHFLRKAFSHILAPISETTLEQTKNFAVYQIQENKFVVRSAQFLGGGLGGLMGVGMGAGLSAITGDSFLPTMLMVGGSFVGKHIGEYACEGVTGGLLKLSAEKISERLDNNLRNLINYYSYSLVPLTREEHSLYNLNPNPTNQELTIFADDYTLRDKLSQQSLLGELKRDIFSEKPAVTALREENSWSADVIIGQLAAKEEKGQSLTQVEKALFDNLSKYPSFAIKQKEIELVKFWCNDSKTLGERIAELNKVAPNIRKRLIEVYYLYGEKIPAILASVYQRLGSFDMTGKFRVDFINVEEIIAENLKSSLNRFSAIELQLLQDAMKDENFLYQYFKEFFSAKEIPEDDQAGEAPLKDPQLISGLVSAYIEGYKELYEDEINNIRSSLLGYGLSDPEIIDLHQHMTDQQLQDYASPLKLTLGEAIQLEVQLIRNKLGQYITGNEDFRVRYYTEDFIYNWSIFSQVLKVFHQQIETREAKEKIENLAKETKLTDEQLERARLKSPDASEDTIKLALAQTNWFYNNFLVKMEEFTQFRKKLSISLKEESLRKRVYTDIKTYIFDYLLSTGRKVEEWDQDEWEMVDRQEVQPTITPTIVPSLGLWERGDSGGIYLSELIRQLQSMETINKDIQALSYDEVAFIQRQIHNLRRSRCLDFDAVTMSGDHLIELLHFKNQTEEYQTKLFYSYDEISNKIQAKNREIIRKFKLQDKQKLIISS